MKDEIILAELFAGIGGFTKGFIEAGFKVKEHYYSEIADHPIANYKYNFPNARYIGSVTDISGREFPGVDIITGGFPCQPFSLAGKRLGFEDARGTMFFEIIRILLVSKPKCVVLENVKGLLNHDNGRTFATIYRLLSEIGYTVEVQLLNTKWFLPQNRERIYIIGHLAGSSRPGVFPFGENDFGFNEGAIKTAVVRTLTAGGNSGGLHSSMTLIAAIRGRNPENQSQRIAGQNQVQTLEINEKGVSNTLSTVQKDNVVIQLNPSKESGGTQPYQQNRVYDSKGLMTSLDTRSNQKNVFISGSYINNVRRLTEIECERLQGFPDDWTKYGMYLRKKIHRYIYGKKKSWRTAAATQKLFVHAYNNTKLVKKEIPATARYKMCGNAVSTPPVKEIGKRIKLI